MINLHTILIPFTIGSALALAGLGLLALALVTSTRKELRRREALRISELAELHDVIAGLRTKVDELSAESRERPSVPAPFEPRMALNLHKRAEALRMFRRGSDTHTVSAALGLPRADIALLQKVSRILCAEKN